jgi:hypothetical protein
MARTALAVGLVALVVLSGCLTADPAGRGPAATPTDSAPPTPKNQPHKTLEGYDNPWNANPIEVVVENPTGYDQDVHGPVQRSLTYWERQTDSSSAYDPEYRLVSQSDDPEIRVEVVRTVDNCGTHDESVALGCAPVLTDTSEVNGTITVQVRAGHSEAATRAILKHEFGHTLGLEHGEGPGNVMSHDLSARSPDDIRDANERRYPWSTNTLEVAVVSRDGVPQSKRADIREALTYYERGAGGTVPNPPTFDIVEDAARADVVVDLQREVEECSGVGPAASCVEWDGPDVDDDGNPEYYTGAKIVVGENAWNRADWHTGYWLGHSLWVNGIPNPFRFSDRPPANTW